MWVEKRMWPIILSVVSKLNVEVTGSKLSMHVYCKCGNILEIVHERDVLNRKWYRIEPFQMTVGDLQNHSPVTSIFRSPAIFLTFCAAVDNILTDTERHASFYDCQASFYELLAFTGWESLNASNTSSSLLPTKFSQLPNLHTFITSSPFNVPTVFALHPSLLLLGHRHHPL